MNTAKHSPGPWFHATDIGQVGSVEFADGTVIAQAQQLPGDVRHEQRNANARLIAAAPEMLEALKMLSFAAQTTGGTAGRDDGLIAAVDAARAAIAKATWSAA